MKKKKVSSKDVFTYTAIICVLILVAFYFLFYKKYQDMTETTRRSNSALSQRISDLKIYYDNEEQYLLDTEALKVALANLLDIYPADTREEDVIMMATNIQAATPIEYSAINIDEREIIQDISQDIVVQAKQEQYQNAIQFVELNASYSNVLTYFSLKDAIRTILDSDYRLSIKNITYAKNEEDGTLDGVIDIGFYSVSGTGKEYSWPAIPAYESGTDNIFGDVAVSENGVAAGQ